MFEDTDTNKDSLVNNESFPKLVDTATSIPGMYEDVPTNLELYKAEDEKKHAGRNMIDFMDFEGKDVITVDEWLKFCMEYIIIKVSMFVDTNKDNLVSRGSFSKFIDMAASILGMYGYATTDAGMYETEDEEEQAERRMIDSTGASMTTDDEWSKFGMEDAIAKAATLADSDTNKDDLVIRGLFSKIMDMALSIPRMCAPIDVELFKAEVEKEQAGRKMTDDMHFGGTDMMIIDEGVKINMEPRRGEKKKISHATMQHCALTAHVHSAALLDRIKLLFTKSPSREK